MCVCVYACVRICACARVLCKCVCVCVCILFFNSDAQSRFSERAGRVKRRPRGNVGETSRAHNPEMRVYPNYIVNRGLNHDHIAHRDAPHVHRE